MTEATQPAESRALTTQAVGSRGLQITSINDLWRLSQYVAVSGLAPKGMEKPESILVAIQLGLELGLSPLASLQNIAIINGKPGVYGDAAKALVENSGLLEAFEEWFEDRPGHKVDELPEPIPDTARAVCFSKRRGRSGKTTIFGVRDAKRASLWGKTGPWAQYPQRMLMFRARGFNLRDNFPDVLRGLKTTEELQDYPVEARVVHVEATPVPAPVDNGTAEAAPPPPAKITRAQIGTIKKLAEKLELSSDQGLVMIQDRYGASKSADLTSDQADDLIKHLTEALEPVAAGADRQPGE